MPVALLVAGPPASGKSVLAGALARELGAVLLDQDVVTGPLTAVVASLLGTDDLDDPALAGATRAARYEALYAIAAANLAVGRSAVLVAPFTAERRDPSAFAAVATRLKPGPGPAPRPVPVTLVWLRASPSLLSARLAARAADRDRAKLADLAAFLDRVDLAPPAVDHIPVNASDTVSDQVRTVLAALDAGGPGRQ